MSEKLSATIDFSTGFLLRLRIAVEEELNIKECPKIL